jgi:hypothetical protein
MNRAKLLIITFLLLSLSEVSGQVRYYQVPNERTKLDTIEACNISFNNELSERIRVELTPLVNKLSEKETALFVIRLFFQFFTDENGKVKLHGVHSEICLGNEDLCRAQEAIYKANLFHVKQCQFTFSYSLDKTK